MSTRHCQLSCNIPHQGRPSHRLHSRHPFRSHLHSHPFRPFVSTLPAQSYRFISSTHEIHRSRNCSCPSLHSPHSHHQQNIHRVKLRSSLPSYTSKLGVRRLLSAKSERSNSHPTVFPRPSGRSGIFGTAKAELGPGPAVAFVCTADWDLAAASKADGDDITLACPDCSHGFGRGCDAILVTASLAETEWTCGNQSSRPNPQEKRYSRLHGVSYPSLVA